MVNNTLTLDQITSAIQATEFLNQQGIMWNVHIIISWRQMDLTDPTEIAEAFSMFKQHLQQLQKRRGWFPCFAWSMEHSEKLGLHAHLITHIPRRCHRSFEMAVREWLPDRPNLLKAQLSNADTATVQGQLLRYIVKNVPPDGELTDITGEIIPVAKAIGLIRDPAKTYDGMVPVQRFGLSRSIDKAARTKAGFTPSKSLSELFPPTAKSLKYSA